MDQASDRRFERRRVTAFIAALAALIVIPVVVVAADRFDDVPDSNVHHDDIKWLADSGVTFGCNPPANDRFCPEQPVLRQQMASFLRRLAENRVVDAATAAEAEHAETADRASSAPGTLLAATSLDVNCASLASGDSTYRKVVDVGTFDKANDDSTMLLTFNGRVGADTIPMGTGAIFELRVDDTVASTGRARVNMRTAEAGVGGIQASMKGIFDGLPAGTHTVSIWARASLASGTATGLRVDPGCWGTDHVVVEEYAG